MTLQHTKNYIEQAMLERIGWNGFSGINDYINQFSGHYTNDQILGAIVGVGTRYDGTLEIALDSEQILHKHICTCLRDSMCNKFFLGTNKLQVINRS